MIRISTSSNPIYKISISGSEKHLEQIKELIHFISTQHGLEDMEADLVELAIGEACHNAFRHGVSSNRLSCVDLEISIDEKAIKAVIKNRGEAFEFDDIEPFNINQDFMAYKNGSLGIPLIKALMDEVNFERKPDNINEITLIKYIKKKKKEENSEMRIKETIKGDVTLLTLSGKMMNGPESIHLHPYIKELIEKSQIKIVVDMGKVKWFASTGLGALLASYTSLCNAGGDLRIARPTRKIYSVLMTTQLVKVFKSFDTVDEAIESYETG